MQGTHGSPVDNPIIEARYYAVLPWWWISSYLSATTVSPSEGVTTSKALTAPSIPATATATKVERPIIRKRLAGWKSWWCGVVLTWCLGGCLVNSCWWWSSVELEVNFVGMPGLPEKRVRDHNNMEASALRIHQSSQPSESLTWRVQENFLAASLPLKRGDQAIWLVKLLDTAYHLTPFLSYQIYQKIEIFNFREISNLPKYLHSSLVICSQMFAVADQPSYVVITSILLWHVFLVSFCFVIWFTFFFFFVIWFTFLPEQRTFLGLLLFLIGFFVVLLCCEK